LAEKLNFDRVLSSPTVSEDKFFAVYYMPNKAPRSRVGVSTAKKIVNKATKRNKLKRLIKKSFLGGLKCEDGFDVVVRVKHQASRVADDKILIESLTSHWQKIMKHSTKTSTTNG
jgi:ribonuclease P protein component